MNKRSDCLEDSEEEIDNTLIQEMEEKMIDEPSNVNLIEKPFIKLLNTLTQFSMSPRQYYLHKNH